MQGGMFEKTARSPVSEISKRLQGDNRLCQQILGMSGCDSGWIGFCGIDESASGQVIGFGVESSSSSPVWFPWQQTRKKMKDNLTLLARSSKCFYTINDCLIPWQQSISLQNKRSYAKFLKIVQLSNPEERGFLGKQHQYSAKKRSLLLTVVGRNYPWKKGLIG